MLRNDADSRNGFKITNRDPGPSWLFSLPRPTGHLRRWRDASIAQSVHKKRYHASRVISRAIVRRHAQARNRAKKVVRIDVRPNHAGGDGGREERPEGRPQVLLEI